MTSGHRAAEPFPGSDDHHPRSFHLIEQPMKMVAPPGRSRLRRAFATVVVRETSSRPRYSSACAIEAEKSRVRSAMPADPGTYLFGNEFFQPQPLVSANRWMEMEIGGCFLVIGGRGRNEREQCH